MRGSPVFSGRAAPNVRPIPLVGSSGVPLHAMDSWQDVFSTVTGLIGAFAAVVTLPGLTRRARLTRQLRRSLELAELLKGKPDLDAAREVLLRRARRAATVLR